jgi:hypothetical protein
LFALLIPLGVAAWWFFGRSPKALTSSHEATIAKALESTNAAAIQKVAVAFGAEGFPEVSMMLMQRARLEGRGASEVRVHQDAVRDAIVAPVRSGECKYTRATADRLKRRGLTCTGRFLVDYANGLERSQHIAPVFVELVGPSGDPEPVAGSSQPLPPETIMLSEQDAEAIIPPPVEARQAFGNPPLQVGENPGPPLGAGLVEDMPEAEAGGGEQ